MINNEMPQKQNNDGSYWRNFLDGDVIVQLCNSNSNVKEIIETLIIINEDIKQYLDTIYKINDTETIDEMLNILATVWNASCEAITLEDILKCFEIYPEQLRNFSENGIEKFPLFAIKLRKNNYFHIQIIELIGGIISSLKREECCHKQILIPDIGYVNINYDIYATDNDDIIYFSFVIEKLDEMTRKQNNDGSYWRDFLDEQLIFRLCNLDSNVKKIIATLIIKNEKIKQYLNIIYKINDTKTIDEILDILTAVYNAFCIKINLENILERFEIYPEQLRNFSENGIGYFPITEIKLRKNNWYIIQIIKLMYEFFLFLLGEERSHKQILIPDFGLVDIKYEMYEMKDKDIIYVLFSVEKLNEMKT